LKSQVFTIEGLIKSSKEIFVTIIFPSELILDEWGKLSKYSASNSYLLIKLKAIHS
jgi:hypothetical protein